MPENLRDAKFETQLSQWEGVQCPVSPELQTNISGLLKSSLAPVNPLPSQNRLALIFLLVFSVCSVGLIAILDKAGFRLMTAAQMSWMAAILGGGGILFSFALVWQMVPGSRRRVPLPLAPVLAGLGVIAAFALVFPWRIPGAFLSEGWPCATLEAAIAIPATGVFWAFARRGALFASAGVGATVTGLAVFLALMPLQFQCMFPQAPHLLLWHGGTAAILIALGALVSRSCHGRLQ